MFWLSYECFSILCHAFLLKSAISSHNSCDDQPHNENFCRKLESVQYNAALAITGTIHGTSQTKLYVELGLESLKARRWFRRLCYFYKFKSYGLPPYLFQLIPQKAIHTTRNSEELFQHTIAEQTHLKTPFFHGSFMSGINLI